MFSQVHFYHISESAIEFNFLFICSDQICEISNLFLLSRLTFEKSFKCFTSRIQFLKSCLIIFLLLIKLAFHLIDSISSLNRFVNSFNIIALTSNPIEKFSERVLELALKSLAFFFQLCVVDVSKYKFVSVGVSIGRDCFLLILH